MNPDREKAERRAKILWEFYHRNGRLLIADIVPLIGVPRDTLYDTFSKSGIEAPPVWNGQLEKTRRKAGSKFPKIIDRVESLPTSMHGRINSVYYPMGLQVLSWWYGPTKKEITYLLR